MSFSTTLLRQFDPLGDDDPRVLEEARERMRQTVVAAASARSLPHRRAMMRIAGSVAAAAVIAGAIVLSERETLRAAVRFEVRLAEERPVPGLIVAQWGNSNRLLYLHPEAVVTNDDVAVASVQPDGPDRFSIAVELVATAAERMRQATTAHVGKPLAILIDGDIVMAPVVRSPIGQSATITGGYSYDEARRIADGIQVR